jgi:hypothetical protein
MKYIKLLLTGVFVCLGLTFFANEAVAQCVKCEARTATFVCVGSNSGGNSCFTDGGLQCILTGVCNSTNPGGPKPPHQPNLPRMVQEGTNTCPSSEEGNQRFKGKVELDADIIRQISAVHPRFAMALALLSKNEDFSDYAKVYLRAVNITPADVEAYLNRNSKSSPLSMEEIRQLQSAPVTPETELIIYEINFTQADDSTKGTLRLRVVQGATGDPALNLLEIDLTQTPSGTNQQRWKATGWQAR